MVRLPLQVPGHHRPLRPRDAHPGDHPPAYRRQGRLPLRQGRPIVRPRRLRDSYASVRSTGYGWSRLPLSRCSFVGRLLTMPAR